MQPQLKSSPQPVQQWRKGGIVFTPDTSLWWMQSHTATPKALVLDDRIRIYFGTRCKDKRTRTGYVDVALDDPSKVLDYAKEPVLDVGPPGHFDSAGIGPASVLKLEDGRVYLYYHGWEILQMTPYRLAPGLAISEDGGKTFHRYSNAPIFERTHEEPVYSNNPFVVKEDNAWRMWYAGITEWKPVNGKLEMVYTIRYGHSKDGIHWQRDNQVCIVPTYDTECAFNASVLKDGGLYKMWYCYRPAGKEYRIGYAESADGQRWTRMDDAINLEISDWDSVMQTYPCVVDVGGKRIMFYNGNGYGQSGIGYAVLSA